MNALIAVDVQNDFCPGGAVPVPEGDAVVGPINRLAEEFELVIATRDWHPADHGSFREAGGIWPTHCVKDTTGAEFHPGLHRDEIDVILDKGQDPGREGYSAFEDTGLDDFLRDRHVDHLHVAGLALDYCVKATALDGVRLGFPVTVHLGATRPAELTPGDGARAVEELRAAGVEVVED